MIKLIKQVGAAFGLVGSILAFVGSFLPWQVFSFYLFGDWLSSGVSGLEIVIGGGELIAKVATNLQSVPYELQTIAQQTAIFVFIIWVSAIVIFISSIVSIALSAIGLAKPGAGGKTLAGLGTDIIILSIIIIIFTTFMEGAVSYAASYGSFGYSITPRARISTGFGIYLDIVGGILIFIGGFISVKAPTAPARVLTPSLYTPARIPTKTCPTCGAYLVEGVRFCTKCGAKMEEKPTKRFCTQCGATINPEKRFCTQCGSAMR